MKAKLVVMYQEISGGALLRKTIEVEESQVGNRHAVFTKARKETRKLMDIGLWISDAQWIPPHRILGAQLEHEVTS